MKICITGKPCSGKTTAINYIKDAGYNTWVADKYVRQLYQANKPGYKLIKKHFGNKFVTKKEVNRPALGKLVFTNKNALKKLNKLINPLIRKAIIKLDKKKNWFIELGTYIFYPQDFANCFDKIILVFSDKNWKENHQNKKFFYLKKIPTIFVDKVKKTNHSIFNIDKSYCRHTKICVDIFVNNCKSKNILKKNILKICSFLI